MVVEGILQALIQILTSLFSYLPEVNFDFSPFYEFIDGLCIFFQYVFYFFPMNTVIFCVYIILFIQLFRIVISFIRTLWELLPIAQR